MITNCRSYCFKQNSPPFNLQSQWDIFWKIAPLAPRDLTTDRLTQELLKHHISHPKCPKKKSVFAFFDSYCIRFDIKLTIWLILRGYISGWRDASKLKNNALNRKREHFFVPLLLINIAVKFGTNRIKRSVVKLFFCREDWVILLSLQTTI
jgi:hypothetical protein